MKLSVIAMAAAALVLTTPLAFAGKGGAKNNAPGQQMLRYGPVSGSPGASGYAPGHLKNKNSYRGASAYAPGYKMKTKSAKRYAPVRATGGMRVR